MREGGLTCWFPIDPRSIGGNPLKIETPFGVAQTVSAGNEFRRADALEARAEAAEAERDALKEEVERIKQQRNALAEHIEVLLEEDPNASSDMPGATILDQWRHEAIHRLGVGRAVTVEKSNDPA